MPRLPSTQVRSNKGKPATPAQLAAMARARQARDEKAAQRRANKLKAEDDLRSYPERPASATWLLDEVISAVLQANDSIESRRIVNAMIAKAAAGNVQATQFLAERSQGKPLQKIQVSGGLTLESMDKLLPDVPEVPSGEPGA